MASSGHDFFSHVRSKLRPSRSSLLLPASSSTNDLTTSRPEVEPWEDIPAEYRPVERAAVRPPSDHYIPYRPTPGPPPRPRTTSPAAVFRPKLRIDTGNGPSYTKPKEHRRRSDQYFSTGVLERNSRMHQRNQQAQDRRKSMSVEIAAALPPDHFNPPPPYSLPQEAPEQNNHHSHTRPQSYQAYHPKPLPGLRPYDPRDYVSTSTSSAHSTYHPSNTRRAMMEVPTIEAQEPTPVSPINSLDQQYLALRRRGPSITVDSLLAHPMLQR
ncbi:uncharacterized protein PV06_03282 [Exophiala oligosperma]|nr:uncharacterized protein PV06_03282 [Exophiala oligosperma]KIW44839.1 hypothetical protein PV06_03282 [Exophiala oligosperma]